MASKLPVIKANTTQENIDKMKFIAEENKRRMAKELELIVEKHIKEFEKEHGEITLKSSKEIWNEQMELIKNPTKGILKKSLNNGKRYGDALGREVVEKIKGKQETENQPLD